MGWIIILLWVSWEANYKGEGFPGGLSGHKGSYFWELERQGAFYWNLFLFLSSHVLGAVSFYYTAVLRITMEPEWNVEYLSYPQWQIAQTASNLNQSETLSTVWNIYDWHPSFFFFFNWVWSRTDGNEIAYVTKEKLSRIWECILIQCLSIFAHRWWHFLIKIYLW